MVFGWRIMNKVLNQGLTSYFLAALRVHILQHYSRITSWKHKNCQCSIPTAKKNEKARATWAVVWYYENQHLIATLREKLNTEFEPVKRRTIWNYNIIDIKREKKENIKSEVLVNPLKCFERSLKVILKSICMNHTVKKFPKWNKGHHAIK